MLDMVQLDLVRFLRLNRVGTFKEELYRRLQRKARAITSHWPGKPLARIIRSQLWLDCDSYDFIHTEKCEYIVKIFFLQIYIRSNFLIITESPLMNSSKLTYTDTWLSTINRSYVDCGKCHTYIIIYNLLHFHLFMNNWIFTAFF